MKRGKIQPYSFPLTLALALALFTVREIALMLVEPKVSGAGCVAVVAETVMVRRSRGAVRMRRVSLMLFTSFTGTSFHYLPVPYLAPSPIWLLSGFPIWLLLSGFSYLASTHRRCLPFTIYAAVRRLSESERIEKAENCQFPVWFSSAVCYRRHHHGGRGERI